MQRINNIELINRIRNQNQLQLVRDREQEQRELQEQRNQNNLEQEPNNALEIERQRLNSINVNSIDNVQEKIQTVWLKIKAHVRKYPKSDFRFKLKREIDQYEVGQINFNLDAEIGDELFAEQNAEVIREINADPNRWKETDENINRAWSALKLHVAAHPNSYYRHWTKTKIRETATWRDYIGQLLEELAAEYRVDDD